MTSNQHATLPPSSSSRWILCPGSVQLEAKLKAKYGEPESSPAAELGTHLHELAAQVLNEEIGLLDISDENHRELVQGYVDQVAVYEQRLKSRAKVEVKVEAPRWTSYVWGTIDCLVYDGDTMVIMDLKTGYGPVQAKENTQLLCYAALAREHLKINPSQIILAIWQPRANDDDLALREWELSGFDLDRYAAEIKHAAQYAMSPEGKLAYYPGEVQCRWCSAAGFCKKRARTEAVLAFFDDHEPVDTLDLDETIELLAMVDDVDVFISQLRAAGLRRAMAGEDLVHWKLVRSRTNRRITDPVALEEELRRKRVLVRDFREPAKLKSFTKLLKHPKAGPIVKQYLEAPEGKPVLAPVSDPREAIRPGDEFLDAPEINL